MADCWEPTLTKVPLAGRQAAYLEIADWLRGQIAAKAFEDGRVPSGAELRDMFDVSQETIRKALDLLKAEGLVASQQGRGVYVRERKLYERSTIERYRRAAWAAGKSAGQVDLGPRAAQHGVDMNEVAEESATEAVARQLGISEGDTVIARRRRYLDEDRPFQYAESFLPYYVVEGTQATQLDSGRGGSWARIEEKGWRFTRVIEEVESRMPTFEEARRLRMQASTPIFVIHRLSYGVDAADAEAVLDYSVIQLPCDARILRYELPVL